MPKLFPVVKSVVKRSSYVKETQTAEALRALETWADQVSTLLAKSSIATSLPVTGGDSSSSTITIGFDITPYISGMAGRIPKFATANTLTDSPLSTAASTVTVNGQLIVQDLTGTRITVSGASGVLNNWAPPSLSTATIIELVSSGGTIEVTGIDATGVTAGRLLILKNLGGTLLILYHEHGSSTATNRFSTQAFNTMTVGNGGAITLYYNGTRWVQWALDSFFENTKSFSGDVGIGQNLTVNGNITGVGNASFDGNVTLGNSSTLDTHTVKGRTTVDDIASAATAQRIALTVASSGTYDTTAGVLNAYAMVANATATRSVGGNNLINTAIYANASGAQVNEALVTDNGTIRLNAISGSTGIGVSPSTKLHVLSGSSPGISSVTNTIITSAGDSTSNPVVGLSVLATGHKKLVFGNGTASDDGQIEYDASGRDMRFRTAQTVRLTISSAGHVNALFNLDVDGDSVFGTSISNTHTFTGSMSISDEANSFTVNTSPSAATTSLSAASISLTGTLNTTSGALNSSGLVSVVSTTRSAGANDLRNKAGEFSASGAQVNVALHTAEGDNYFNSAGGSTGIGYSLGASLPSLFSVNGSARIIGALTVDGNVRLGNAAGDTIGFYTTAGTTQPTITGSRGGNAALASLLTALAAQGLIVDSTTA